MMAIHGTLFFEIARSHSAFKGQSSRSPIIGPVNKSFETPGVNQFFFLNAVSDFYQNQYLSSRFNPQFLFGIV